MGTPQHYSLELPECCLQLIEELWPAVMKVRAPDQPHLGPLTTTFLLAMATPIITLPIERVERHFGRNIHGYFDDRSLDIALAREVARVFSSPRFEAAPFFAPGLWRFATIPYRGENLSRLAPHDLIEQLASSDAYSAASNLPVPEWASCLRNALAHGGVIYLDRDGRQSFEQETVSFAFVSAKYPNGNMRLPPERLKALRITEDGFRSFLKSWVEWLQSSGLGSSIAA